MVTARFFWLMGWSVTAVLLASPVVAQAPPVVANADVQPNVPTRDYSAAEIQLLQELDVERIKLERRAQALELREKLVDLAEERLSGKVSELRDLKEELQRMLRNMSSLEEEELQQLARIYEAMKPVAAAEIMNRLDNAIVYDVFRRMNAKKVAKIMESMALPKARFLSELMAQETPLPTIGATAPAAE